MKMLKLTSYIHVTKNKKETTTTITTMEADISLFLPSSNSCVHHT